MQPMHMHILLALLLSTTAPPPGLPSSPFSPSWPSSSSTVLVEGFRPVVYSPVRGGRWPQGRGRIGKSEGPGSPIVGGPPGRRRPHRPPSPAAPSRGCVVIGRAPLPWSSSSSSSWAGRRPRPPQRPVENDGSRPHSTPAVMDAPPPRREGWNHFPFVPTRGRGRNDAAAPAAAVLLFQDPLVVDPHSPGRSPMPDRPIGVWANFRRDEYRKIMDGNGGRISPPRGARPPGRGAGFDLDLDPAPPRSPSPPPPPRPTHDTGGGDRNGEEEYGVGAAGDAGVGGVGRLFRRRSTTVDHSRTSAAAFQSREEGTDPRRSRRPRVARDERRHDALKSDVGEHGDYCHVPHPGLLGPREHGLRNPQGKLPAYAPGGGNGTGTGTGEAAPSSPPTPREVALLDDIGLDRTLPPTPKSPRKQHRRRNVSFSERLSQLSQFKSEHGHLLVPRSHPTLGSFVNNARVQYGRRRDGKSSTMTPERISALERLGFCWRVGRNPDEAWDRRVEELEAFRVRHGHCDVPSNCVDDPGLGRWAARQRAQYRLLERGEPSTLTRTSGPEGTTTRLDELEGLGFAWARRRGRHLSSLVTDNRTARSHHSDREARPRPKKKKKKKKKKGVRLLEVPPPRVGATTGRKSASEVVVERVAMQQRRNLTSVC